MTNTNEPSGHIFLLRLWPVEGSGESSQWRGKVQNIVQGEAANFADLSALADCLLTLLPAPVTRPGPLETHGRSIENDKPLNQA